ncbi:MAG: hypothetical protein KatS3mg115_1798 [Candidatus Poribacteria bacterium]|nr:MAG: hypothetical protein KatS3mg115_1798 [Candidatus Poribacteria bacterium]
MDRSWFPIVSVLLIVFAFVVGRVTAGAGGERDYRDYYAKAAAAYQEAVNLDSPPADASDPERWNRVLALYRVVFDGYPDSPYADDALYAIASRIDVQTDADTAFILYRKLLQRYPDSEYAPQALNAIGVAHFQREDYDRAVVVFDEFLQRFPTHPLREKVLLNRAVCQIERDEYNDALQTLERFTEEFPMSEDIPASVFYVGVIHYKKQEFEEARKQFRNLVDLGDPEWAPAALFNIGQTYFDERRYDEAIETYRQVIQQFPEDKFAEEAAFRIGWALERQRKYAEAVEALREAIEKYPHSPNTPAAQIFMAQIYNQGLNDVENAVAAYRPIADGTMDVSPLVTDQISEYDIRRDAQYQIGRIYEEHGMIEQAIAEYEKLLKNFPEPHSNPAHRSNEIDEAKILDLRARLSSGS